MEHERQRKQIRDARLEADKAVAELLAQGKTRPEIVEELSMPLGSVNMRCSRLFEAFGVTNNVAFTLAYLENGRVIP